MLLRERSWCDADVATDSTGTGKNASDGLTGLAIERPFIPDPANERVHAALKSSNESRADAGRGGGARTGGDNAILGEEPDRLADLQRRFGTTPIVLFLLLLLAGNLGCGGDFSLSDNPSLVEPFSQLDLDAEPAGDEVAENESFAQAQQLPVSVGVDYTLRGSIDSADDVDVYDVGPVETGDRVLAEVFADDGLQAAIALFDENGHSLLVNDSRNAYLGRLEPYVDIVARRGSAQAYLVVTSTPGTLSTGDYTLAVRIDPGAEAPSPTPQRILLNFDGAEDVGFGGRPDIDIPAFDAAGISPIFAGASADIADLITALVREDFAGLDVEILSTVEGASADEETSVIHFGTYDAALLGVAESVDEYNGEARQDAIVFTDTFAAFNPLNPSIDEMAQAIANVASHEIGHLLGLVHTSGSEDLMDITASLSQLMLDQSFAVAGLHPTVFLIGMQNSPVYLSDSVGADAAVQKAAARTALMRRAAGLLRRPPGSPDLPRSGLHFGSCGHGPRRPD